MSLPSSGKVPAHLRASCRAADRKRRFRRSSPRLLRLVLTQMLETIFLRQSSIAIGRGAAVDDVNVRMRMHVADKLRQSCESRFVIGGLLRLRIGLVRDG